jgi:hypothetical protein
LSVLSIAAVVAAAAVVAKPGLYNDGTPPKRFRHDATITVQLTDQPGINRDCQALFGKPPPGSKTNACYTGTKAIMPNPCDYPATDAYAHMLCHELGHANGWPSTHGP